MTNQILNLSGQFTWMWGNTFFIETCEGNFLWSDPEYGGDSTIKKYPGNMKKYLKETDTLFGRCKGRHVIKDYCPGATVA